jgi:DNA-binding CsgD family transcriptional regulator
MSLSLSSAELAAVERASIALLSPFAHPDSESWKRDACRAVEACLGGDGSSFALPIANEPRIAAVPEIERALEAVSPPPAWVFHGLTVRRRSLGLRVTDWDELFDASLVKSTPFYNEIVRPQGLMAPLVMLAETDRSPLPAALSVYFTNERTAKSHMQRRKQLLRLLYPAFCGGLRAYLGAQQNIAAMTVLADEASVGVLFFDGSGIAMRENDLFGQMMSADPDRDRVRAEIRRMVRGVLGMTTLYNETAGTARTRCEMRTPSSHYHITATLLATKESGQVEAIVSVEKTEARALTLKEARARYSLTLREAQVAELLRAGLSSRDLANTLGISVNTARRHIEQILLKLDVHTRTAAAVKLFDA